MSYTLLLITLSLLIGNQHMIARSNISNNPGNIQKQCPPLMKPKNGDVKIKEGKYQDTTMFIAEYSCDPGYDIKGFKGSYFKRHCYPVDFKSYWSGSIPWCKLASKWYTVPLLYNQ